jgi:hypothetical protein
MKYRPRDVVLAVVALSIGFAAPTVIVPTVSSFLGIAWLRGIQGISMTVGGGVPLPILRTPDSYVFTGSVMASALFAAYVVLRRGAIERSLLRKQALDAIPIVSSYVRTGVPLARALELTSEVMGSPMKECLYRAAKLLQLGHDPFEAFEAVFSSTPRDVRVALSAIPIAIVSGGRVAEVLEIASRHSYQLSRLDDMRRFRLEGYKGTLALAAIAYIATAIVMVFLLSYLAKMGAGTPIIGISIDIHYIASLYYVSAIIVFAITSVAISRITYGEAVFALKYSAMLMLFTSIAFAIGLAII